MIYFDLKFEFFQKIKTFFRFFAYTNNYTANLFYSHYFIILSLSKKK